MRSDQGDPHTSDQSRATMVSFKMEMGQETAGYVTNCERLALNREAVQFLSERRTVR
jgi:hypothetical protein